jgi:hypothetical protein
MTKLSWHEIPIQRSGIISHRVKFSVNHLIKSAARRDQSQAAFSCGFPATIAAGKYNA